MTAVNHTDPSEVTPDRSEVREFAPIHARTETFHHPVRPVAYDSVKFIVVRGGSARLFSEFGCRHVNIGDVIVLAANTLCGAEPDDWITTTTLYLDREYVIDQVFWQYAAQFRTRLDASSYLDAHYAEPAQVVRIGEARAGLLMPWLDELAGLSLEGPAPERYYRAQALLFSVLDVVVPNLKMTGTLASATQRTAVFPSHPRHRQFHPLRDEARHAAHLLSADRARKWKVPELAEEVHLSISQFRRVFVDAFGKSPIAYLTMLRAERMAELLQKTDLPISVIANEVGWADPEFAARQFRRSVGVSPSKYRQISQSNTPGSNAHRGPVKAS
ncbi:helix-turn-helix transcriptional regulator [Leucobacter aridicollis]|uniref:AraC-like DNA-binding protein n=1 Tax=Leucobacter aridicollis TaxID=283878 RepID=A0A852R5M0_9MICO|nr:AraC family transcriptional regulator [Leucobacter aridicollis]MBL3682342.1 AraC family transcriptional regulator [Leucobacter aridicollis]NYD25759.1 AraC-like DNA-binding protein [Leucobacter aridicollis]